VSRVRGSRFRVCVRDCGSRFSGWGFGCKVKCKGVGLKKWANARGKGCTISGFRVSNFGSRIQGQGLWLLMETTKLFALFWKILEADCLHCFGRFWKLTVCTVLEDSWSWLFALFWKIMEADCLHCFGRIWKLTVCNVLEDSGSWLFSLFCLFRHTVQIVQNIEKKKIPNALKERKQGKIAK